MISLTQQSMVKKRLRFEDRVLPCATVFPLFTSIGKVEALLILDHSEGKVYGLSHSKGLVSKPWFRPLRIARKFANLEELSVEKAYQMTRYWHYDPWWLLDESPFGGQPTTKALKTTNCVNSLVDINATYFTRDLSRIDFWARPNGDSISIVHPKSEPLPPREEREAPAEVREQWSSRPKSGWRLRPFWQKAIG